MENDLETLETAKIFGKWLRCMGHGLSIKNVKSEKWIRDLGNGQNIWEMA